jgi:hypothetical protein
VSANCKPDSRRHGPTTPSVHPDPGSRATPSSGFVKAEINTCSISPYGCRKGEHPIFWAHKLPSSASFAPKSKTHRKCLDPGFSFVGNWALTNPDYGLVLDSRSRPWKTQMTDLSLIPDLGVLPGAYHIPIRLVRRINPLRSSESLHSCPDLKGLTFATWKYFHTKNPPTAPTATPAMAST